MKDFNLYDAEFRSFFKNYMRVVTLRNTEIEKGFSIFEKEITCKNLLKFYFWVNEFMTEYPYEDFMAEIFCEYKIFKNKSNKEKFIEIFYEEVRHRSAIKFDYNFVGHRTIAKDCFKIKEFNVCVERFLNEV